MLSVGYKLGVKMYWFHFFTILIYLRAIELYFIIILSRWVHLTPFFNQKFFLTDDYFVGVIFLISFSKINILVKISVCATI